MAAPRALAMVIALLAAACSNPPTAGPSPSSAPLAGPTAGPSSTTLSAPSSAPVASPPASPAGEDPAIAFDIAAPYELQALTAPDLENLSGNIRGLPSDLANAAGAGHAPTDFPMGVRFILDPRRAIGKSVGALVVLAVPEPVAGQPGLLESVAAAVAAEVNATLTYETVGGVKVGVVQGPIASAVAIVQGHLVMAQSGQPSVHPTDLIAAVIAANEPTIQ